MFFIKSDILLTFIFLHTSTLSFPFPVGIRGLASGQNQTFLFAVGIRGAVPGFSQQIKI
jgi:hypothetical protein